MNELLNPTWKDISTVFEANFKGMATEAVTLSELLSARDAMLKSLRASLTEQDKQFLISIKTAEPAWSLIKVEGIEKLPSLQWKVSNVKKMPLAKREASLQKLIAALDLT